MNPSSKAHDVRQALILLGDLDKDIPKVVDTLTNEELVVLGQRLWWLIKRATKALEPIKSKLRGQAHLQAQGATGNRRFEASDGSHCIVSIPPSAPVLRKDADMAKIKILLGTHFDDFFDTQVTYRPCKGFQDMVPLLTPDAANAVMSVLNMAESTPKVTFKD